VDKLEKALNAYLDGECTCQEAQAAVLSAIFAWPMPNDGGSTVELSALARRVTGRFDGVTLKFED